MANHEDYTAIDFAGTHKSYETIFVMVEFFQQNFELLELIFSTEANGKFVKKTLKDINDDDNDYPWIIRKVNRN